jgi:serine/threonine-protein kinase
VTLDRYELLCTIAQGGMATVWLARFRGKHGFEKLVAIKTILPEHALDERFRKMFLDEARIASGIEHPNVAKILDLGEWHDFLYLVMEYVNGDALSRLRRVLSKRGVKMPVQLSIRILADMCAGLHASHELRGSDGELAGVVHRDVSPQNVLIPDNGSAKLIDFGVAKARDRLGGETGGAITKGKSRYMAPEQALGQAIDRRADIFGVGAMAYEIFEGVSPYEGVNDLARLHALMTGAEIQEVRSAPHPAVEKLIIRALSRTPEKRFATALELRGALEDAMVQLRVRATSDDVAEFFAKHTADRITERRRIVKLALDGATERQRIRDQLDNTSMVHSRGRSDSVADGGDSDSDLMVVPSAPQIAAAPKVDVPLPPPPPDAKPSPPRPKVASAPAQDPATAAQEAAAPAQDATAPVQEASAASDEIVVDTAEGVQPTPAPAVVATSERNPIGASVPAYSSTLSEDDAVAPSPPRRKVGLVAVAVVGAVVVVIGIGAAIERASRVTPPPIGAVTTMTSNAPAATTPAFTAPPPPIETTATAPMTATQVTTARPTATAVAVRPPPTTRGTATKPTASGKKIKPTDVVIQ